jgi:hypothetical protein
VQGQRIVQKTPGHGKPRAGTGMSDPGKPGIRGVSTPVPELIRAAAAIC